MMAGVYIASMQHEPQKPAAVASDGVRNTAGPQLRAVPFQELVPLIARPSKGHAHSLPWDRIEPVKKSPAAMSTARSKLALSTAGGKGYEADPLSAASAKGDANPSRSRAPTQRASTAGAAVRQPALVRNRGGLHRNNECHRQMRRITRRRILPAALPLNSRIFVI